MIPLKTFVDRTKFHAWLAQQEAEGRIVEMDVIAARGLVAESGKLDLRA